ncbi:hypothetical protein [Haladaptatus sp. R4]|uniref:hypothetical protein n=1 Tax=Haladaptatus sp. R4 TaxID=1679489 RepID=UPI001CBE95BA|nr:hypothetical protein [Haladaptatus sp. R4]
MKYDSPDERRQGRTHLTEEGGGTRAQEATMKKTIKILLVAAMVGSVFAIGFAGNAAAFADDNQVQVNGQAASSNVDQGQAVAQGNYNSQEDNYAVSGALNVGLDDGESGASSGNAVAVQASAQSNDNSQFAWSNAQNANWQNQDD